MPIGGEFSFRTFLVELPQQAELLAYINNRKKPSPFVLGILAMDPVAITIQGNQRQLENLPAYLHYLHENAPDKCWGCIEKVQEWLK